MTSLQIVVICCISVCIYVCVLVMVMIEVVEVVIVLVNGSRTCPGHISLQHEKKTLEIILRLLCVVFLMVEKNMSKNIYRPPNVKFPQGYVRQCVCVLQ